MAESSSTPHHRTVSDWATANPTVIAPDTVLPGAALLELRSDSGPVIAMRGRIIAEGLPCSVNNRAGQWGCGAEAAMTIVRYPVRGLNLPGEHIVGLLHHCTSCGPSGPQMVTATAEEISNGWAPGTVS